MSRPGRKPDVDRAHLAQVQPPRPGLTPAASQLKPGSFLFQHNSSYRSTIPSSFSLTSALSHTTAKPSRVLPIHEHSRAFAASSASSNKLKELQRRATAPVLVKPHFTSTITHCLPCRPYSNTPPISFLQSQTASHASRHHPALRSMVAV